MQKHPQYILISSNYHGLRLDVALAKLFPPYSRSQLTAWLKAGFITLNSQRAKPKDKVATGDEINLRIEETPKPIELAQPEAISFAIIFEDEVILIINKPPNLVVHPGAGNKSIPC